MRSCRCTSHNLYASGCQSIKVLSRSLSRESLLTSPTLLKSLSGDAEVGGTARYCLALRAKRGNSCTCCFHYIRVCQEAPGALSCGHLARPPHCRHRHPWMCCHLRYHSKYWVDGLIHPMKNVYLSILDVNVRAFNLHCKKTVTLAFPRCGRVFVVTEAKNLV